MRRVQSSIDIDSRGHDEEAELTELMMRFMRIYNSSIDQNVSAERFSLIDIPNIF